MNKRYFIYSVALLLACMSMTGCGSQKKNVQTETPTAETDIIPIQQIMTEKQTEGETKITEVETEAESETEAPKTFDVLKTLYKQTTGTGRLQYELLTDSVQKGHGTFHYENGSYEYLEQDSPSAFVFDDGSFLKTVNEIWQEDPHCIKNIYDPFINIANSFETSTLDGKRCYKITCKLTASDLGEAIVPVYMAGYTNISCETGTFIYYLNDEGSLLRIDMSIGFTGDIGGMEQSATYNAVHYIDSIWEDKIEVPEEIMEQIFPDYTQGIVNNNIYTSSEFGFSFYGKDLLKFNDEKVQELNANYSSLGLSYLSEGVAIAPDGSGIVSISSIKRNADTDPSMLLSRYLDDCAAKDIDNIQTTVLDEMKCISVKSVINKTNTVTYLLSNDTRALFITIYYAQESTIKAVLNQFFRDWENPDWEASEWILEDRYRVITPKGYEISTDNSSGSYLSLLKNAYSELNIFTKKGAPSDIRTKDISSTDDVKKELVSEDIIETAVHGPVTYLVIKENSSKETYYTYEALLPIEEDTVLKYFVVALDDSEDKKALLKEIIDSTSVIDTGTEEETENKQ